MTKTATDWIAYLEAEPRSEPDLSIAAVLREQAKEIEGLISDNATGEVNESERLRGLLTCSRCGAPATKWLRAQLAAVEPSVEPCPATWRPTVEGPAIPCTLPAGHAGKHRAPEPLAEESLLNVTRGQMDFTIAVTRNAMASGLSKGQFLQMVSIGWDAQQTTRDALNRRAPRND